MRGGRCRVRVESHVPAGGGGEGDSERGWVRGGAAAESELGLGGEMQATLWNAGKGRGDEIWMWRIRCVRVQRRW